MKLVTRTASDVDEKARVRGRFRHQQLDYQTRLACRSVGFLSSNCPKTEARRHMLDRCSGVDTRQIVWTREVAWWSHACGTLMPPLSHWGERP